VGAERLLADIVINLMKGNKVDAPPSERSCTRGTPNHKALARAGRYGWAFRYGGSALRENALQYADDFFDQQENVGHYAMGGANEVLTPSHCTWWMLALGGFRAFALEFQHRDLIRRTRRWWRAEVALNRLGQTPDFRVVLPGARSNVPEAGAKGGSSPVRDVGLQLILGKRPFTVRAANRAKGPWWDARSDSGAWAIRWCLETLRDDLGGAARATEADLPKLYNTLFVARAPEGHIGWFPVLDALRPQWIASSDYTLPPGQGDQYWASSSPPPDGRNPYEVPRVYGAPDHPTAVVRGTRDRPGPIPP
jgi:hypothetical protein